MCITDLCGRMSRLLYKPEKIRLDIVIPLFLTGLCCVTYCMKVIDSNTFDFPDQILLCCLTILASNSYYAIATSTQFAKFMTKSFCARIKENKSLGDRQKNKRLSLVDDRMTLEESEDIRIISANYTVVSSITNTIDFEKKTREIRLFISREELWYILYPVSVGIFVMFFCIPTYDVSCSLMLALGFIVLGSFQEWRRDTYWERGGVRRAMFFMLVLSGLILLIALFVLAYTVNSMQQQTLRSNMNSTVFTRFNTTENNMDYMQLLLHNAANSTSVQRNTSDALMQEIMQIYQDRQKLHSFLVRIPVWMWCFYTPFLLGNMPDSTRIPIILELSQSSLGNMCAVVIVCIVSSCQINWSIFCSVNTCAYVMIVPFFIWATIYMILKSSRNKTILYVACILMLSSYGKFAYIITQIYHIHSQHVVRTFVFLAFVLLVNVFFTIMFFRNENFAIHMGWDKYEQNDLCSDTLSDLDEELFSDDNAISKERSYTIDDVLQRVTTDIQQTEHIMTTHNKHASPTIEMTRMKSENDKEEIS